ncbi:MATE family efflux transporter [Puteibacter caeruleilacunae]|nr:MATE family efflux transporter [Puteibacter caeruleilacunae]
MKSTRIDYNSPNISQLFIKILIPTLLGMVSSILVTVADGVFIGRGTGSNGLAAVNIAAPLFLITTGIGLMFGVGSSVVASIHLSRQQNKIANINITQALIASIILMLTLCTIIMIFCPQVANLFGATPILKPLVMEYIYFLTPGLLLYMVQSIGLFIIRLDGSPIYAMLSGLIPSFLNVVLDYLFVFPLQWGIKGAAFATAISLSVGGLMVIIYLLFFSQTIKLHSISLSKNGFSSFLRNILNMCRLGFSGLLNEVAFAVLMFIGNYVFIRYVGEDGVAAFSVACFLYPVAFMLNNAIAQSAQPIISYNYGLANSTRTNKAFKLLLGTALGFGIIITLVMVLFSKQLVSLFLDKSAYANQLASEGIPLFALGFVFFAFNIAFIGYYQSIEQSREANLYVFLRGYLVLLLSFSILPEVIGINGIWLSAPLAEITTSIIILGFFLYKHHRIPSLSSGNVRPNPT